MFMHLANFVITRIHSVTLLRHTTIIIIRLLILSAKMCS